MKEFLEPLQNGNFRYHKDSGEMIGGDWIEIPEGAEIACDWCNDCDFYKLDGNLIFTFENGKWEICDFNKQYFFKNVMNILWQREKVYVEVDNVSEKLSKVDETLKERKSQYGCFEDVAFVTQGFIEIMGKCKYKEMPQPHQMALYMIASKMARLVNGDCNHKDSWHDIGGYAKLIEDLIGDNS